jgi:hypothetical protein
VVTGLQPENYDAFWQPKITAVQAFFAQGYVIIFVTWLTNVSGLAIIYAKMKATENPEITYNAWKFHGTLAMLLGIGIIALSTLPAPLGQASLILSGIAKILEISFTNVLPAETKPKVQTTVTAPPKPA